MDKEKKVTISEQKRHKEVPLKITNTPAKYAYDNVRVYHKPRNPVNASKATTEEDLLAAIAPGEQIVFYEFSKKCTLIINTSLKV